MSNFLLQNAGIGAFFEDDDLFGGDTMCSEVDEDDLPLTNYLLKFDVDEEEPWESEEDLSVGGESVDEEDIFELSWPNPEDLETGMLDRLDHVGEDFTLEREDSTDKAEVGKKKISQAKKTVNAGKKEPVKSSVVVDVDNKKQTKPSSPKNVVKDAFTVHSDVHVKSTNASLERGKKEPQKMTVKSQAEKAKEQRERKKKYVQELQDTIKELKQDKASLQQVTTQLNEKIESLKEEISYLKGVITNQSELAKILRSVANIPGISISCSVLQDDKGNVGKNNKRKCEPAGKKGVNLSDEKSKKRRIDTEVNGELESNAGVCVHVQSGKVSLEFCPECSKKANNMLS